MVDQLKKYKLEEIYFGRNCRTGKETCTVARLSMQQRRCLLFKI